MPRGLKRHQEACDLHFITFSCYHRQPLLATPRLVPQVRVRLLDANLGRGRFGRAAADRDYGVR